jgi:hypothetical protein
MSHKMGTNEPCAALNASIHKSIGYTRHVDLAARCGNSEMESQHHSCPPPNRRKLFFFLTLGINRL